MEAGDYKDPLLLQLEEYAIREAPNARTATVAVDHRELQWMFRDGLNRGVDRQRKTLPKLRSDVVVPRPRFQQVLIGLGHPDHWEGHGFLNRPALTCRHGITSEGFSSCRARR